MKEIWARTTRTLWRLFALVLLCFIALQLYFVIRVAMMIVVDPQSTTFQRSEAWRLLTEKHEIAWSQKWASYDHIATPLKRAVIAAGSARYAVHRYCPHQGADLTEGWVEGGHLLVCPRHRWQFDLEKQGRCTLNSSSLCAERLPDNVEPLPGTVRKVEDQPQPLVALNTAS